jgi:N-acylneuraminate cytidylyltransferase/CMP-N,N'-diacetyllegionaminic acid synthase
MQTIGGLSLVGFKARSAQTAATCTRLIISTDDSEIQAEASRHGADVPFTRPAELATDTASTVDVISHAIDWIETNTREQYDALMLLEPSSPFARGEDYDAAVRLMMERNATVVLGMREMEVNSVFVGQLDDDGRITNIIKKVRGLRGLRRQDQHVECTMNGALYLVRWDFFKRTRSFYSDPLNSYGYVMDRFHSVEVDEPVDLEWARFLVERGFVDMSPWMFTPSHHSELRCPADPDVPTAPK